MAFMNFPLMNYIKTISPRPILFLMGEKAHSRYFTEDAYKLATEPKELYIVPGARHIDLYDRVEMIPFDKLADFFSKALGQKENVTDEQYLGKSGENMEKNALTKRQQSIIPIAAFTADGDIDRLKPALIRGLDAGLTVNEIKEVMVHLYAYTGFPRSLNALSIFMGVLDERKAKGIEDTAGKEAGPVPSDFDKDEYGAKVRAKLAGLKTDISGAPWQLFSPPADTFLKEHLFADLFVRDVISHQDRELATIAALANMTGTGGQLYFHLGAAMNTGLTRAQMEDFVFVLKISVSKTQAEDAGEILIEVRKNRK